MRNWKTLLASVLVASAAIVPVALAQDAAAPPITDLPRNETLIINNPENPATSPDNFNIWLKPKIGQCQADGQFKIVQAAAEHVAPDPMSIYPERGVCKADGLHAPDGTIQKNVL